MFCFLFKVLSDQFLAASGGDRVRFPLVYEMVLDARIAVSDEVAPDKDAAWIQPIVDSRHQYRFPVEWDVVKDQITEDAVKCGFWRELRDILTDECEPIRGRLQNPCSFGDHFFGCFHDGDLYAR